MKQTITTFLTYNNQAEEAAKLYVSIFRNSRITRITRYGAGAPMPEGSAMTVQFELDGQEFIALNGGPHFKFSDGISLSVNCQTQAEIDHYWEKLSAGGEPGPCGWLKDRFGLSWQVSPSLLGELLGDADAARAARVMQAMMQMSRVDIAALQRAADQS